MEAKKVIVVYLIALLVLCAAPAAFAFQDGDWQFWTTDSVEKKLSDKWKATLEEELRWGDDISEFYYMHTDVGFSYKMEKWISVGVNYRQVYEKSGKKWYAEHRPHLHVTGTIRWKDLKLKNRGRLEYRIREDQEKDDSWRYRNKATLSYVLPGIKQNLSPYIADEIFFAFNDKRVSRNRVYMGIAAEVIKNVYLDVYYVTQSTRQSEGWKDYNGMGANLKVVF